MTIKTFFRLLAGAKKYILALSVAMSGVLLSKAAEGFIYKFLAPDLVDKGLFSRDPSFLNGMPILILIMFLTRGIGEFLSKYFMGYVGRSTVRDQRCRMLNKLLEIPISYFKYRTTGEIVSKINYDAEQVATALSDAVLEFFNSAVAIMLFVAILFSFSWQVTLVIMCALPVLGIYLRSVGKIMRRYSARVQVTMGVLTHVASEVVDGRQVIRSYQGQDFELKRIESAASDNRNKELKTFLVTALSAPIMQLMASGLLAGFIFLVTRQSLNLSAGEVVGFIAALFALIQPLKQITQVNNVFQKGIAAADSIHKLLDEPGEKNSGKKIIKRFKQEIKFENVSFSYPNPNIEEIFAKKQVLRDISFRIKAGETIALVGSSGGGKTTLTSLLLRFYDVLKGNIYLDNIDIKDLTLENLRQQFSIVTQNIRLFDDTVYKNIAYGINQNKTKDEIFKAAEAACAMDFIQALPYGFATRIGENGELLSGGQCQRLAIARAILKNAPILILDEATSALDNESEQAIQSALNNIMHGRTTLVIAHRLSTIKKADQILVLERGKIQEFGKHEELLAKGGRYAKLQSL